MASFICHFHVCSSLKPTYQQNFSGLPARCLCVKCVSFKHFHLGSCMLLSHLSLMTDWCYVSIRTTRDKKFIRFHISHTTQNHFHCFRNEQKIFFCRLCQENVFKTRCVMSHLSRSTIREILRMLITSQTEYKCQLNEGNSNKIMKWRYSRLTHVWQEPSSVHFRECRCWFLFRHYKLAFACDEVADKVSVNQSEKMK